MEPVSAPEVSLQEYLLILRRRRGIILGTFVLILAVGVIVTMMTKPVYQSAARLLVDGPSLNLSTVDSANPLSGILVMSPQQTVATQVEVLQSAPLLQKVQQTAGPAQLAVAEVGSTNIIEVSAESTDPKAAAAAPNALLRLYVQQDVNQDLNEITSAEAFARTQDAMARQRLSTDQDRIERFMKKNNVVELTHNRDDQIARVNALTDASQKNRTDLSALRAQIAADRQLLAQEPAVIFQRVQASNAAVAVLQSDINKLQVQRVSMTQRGGFTAASPQVIALDAQITELARQLKSQPALTTTVSSGANSVREALRGKIQDLSAQAAALASQQQTTVAALAEARAAAVRYPGWQATLDRLTGARDADAAQDKMFSDKVADLSLREQAHHASAHVIEAAQVPAAPVRPKKLQSILFAALIGLFLGVCLALLQEFLDDRLNSVEEAGRLLGLPSLGHVPALSAEDAHLMPQMNGLDPASESYRVLRTNIHFASVDAPLRTLLVTSTNPGEGKTTTAANLAFAMAMDGKRVILVDTDLRRPSLHKLLGLPALPGLTDVLLGHAALEPREVMPGLSVLVAGSTPPNPGELLNSRTFRNLVETLAAQADIVIFDSAPVLVAANSVILASQMDGTVMVVETGVTKKGSAKRAMDLLRQARAGVLGIAYNKMRAQDGDGYYYYQYRYGTPSSLEDSHGRPRTLLATTVEFGPDAPASGHDADEGTKK